MIRYIINCTGVEGFLFVLSLLTILGCSEGTQDSAEPSESQEPMTLQRILTEQETGLNHPLRLVIRDPEQWKSIWSEVMRDRSTVTPLPAVDFTRYMVILAAMGIQSTGGHEISIEEVRRDGKHLVVTVRQVSPGPECMTTQVLTSPVDIVQVPKSDEAVTFVEQKEIQNCD